MSHYLIVPTNENGVVFDPTMTSSVATALGAPFGFEDIYVYSHGWSTDGDQAMGTYNRFSVDLARRNLLLATNPPTKTWARNSLGIGIHWPSEVTEDPNSPLNAVQLFSFYTMEHRAEAVGKNAIYAMVRLILTSGDGATALRIFLIGHSFGCKAVCAALNDVQLDIADGTISVPEGTLFRAVLLQGATDNDNLEKGDIYGNMVALENLRVLLTKSSQDEALGTWYPAAGKLANLFHAPPSALGSAGPTQQTITDFGGADSFVVSAANTASDMTQYEKPMVIADLSTVHAARKASGTYTSGGLSGSHSDIFFDPLYDIVAGFLFTP
jgi:hypothetical protein